MPVNSGHPPIPHHQEKGSGGTPGQSSTSPLSTSNQLGGQLLTPDGSAGVGQMTVIMSIYVGQGSGCENDKNLLFRASQVSIWNGEFGFISLVPSGMGPANDPGSVPWPSNLHIVYNITAARGVWGNPQQSAILSGIARGDTQIGDKAWVTEVSNQTPFQNTLILLSLGSFGNQKPPGFGVVKVLHDLVWDAMGSL